MHRETFSSVLTMSKTTIIGISYVSLWVVIWGTIGSLIDFYLLQSVIYSRGSLGQLSTFSITAAIAIILAVILFPNINKRFIN